MLSFKPRNQPSPYPFPVTYILGVSCFVSSAISCGILAYFVYYLKMDNVAVPAQLLFLLATTLITMGTLSFTFFMHIFRSMAPRVSMAINGLLFVLWVVGFVIITEKIGTMVLGHSCAMPMWATSMGVMVCRIYKALYSFIVVATAASGALVVLDISVSNEVTRRGVYREMKDQGQASPELRRGFYVEMKETPDPNGEDDDTTKLVGRTPDLSQHTPKL